MSVTAVPTLVPWFAPGRVNLIGEHTDYNDGLALPFALEHGCRASVVRVGEPTLTVRSEQRPGEVRVVLADIGPDLAPGLRLPPDERWAAYVAGVVWALARELEVDPLALGSGGGLLVDIDADLPIGAGLSSSAALCCAVAGALAEALGLVAAPPLVARVAQAAESEYVGAPTGGMDQLAVSFGVRDHAVLCDLRARSAEPVPLALERHGLAVLVVDTGVAHAHVDGEYAERRHSCEQAAARLGLAALRDATEADLVRLDSPLLRRRARHIVTENARVTAVADLLRADRVCEIGPLLTASHVSMRDDFEITVPVVDACVEALLAAGALGARMTGGGFGGSVIGLVERARAEVAATAALEAIEAITDHRGPGRPGRWFLADPGDGAGPIDV